MPLDSSSCDKYQLIDFGAGRKLELLSGYLVDRPSPAAIGLPRRSPELWRDASARYDEKRRTWIFREPWPSSLLLDCENFSMPVRRPSGIWSFPEQAANWRWIHQQARVRRLRVQTLSGSGKPNQTLMPYRNKLRLKSVTQVPRAWRCFPADWRLSWMKPNVQSCRSAAELNGWQSAPFDIHDALVLRREVSSDSMP